MLGRVEAKTIGTEVDARVEKAHMHVLYCLLLRVQIGHAQQIALRDLPTVLPVADRVMVVVQVRIAQLGVQLELILDGLACAGDVIEDDIDDDSDALLLGLIAEPAEVRLGADLVVSDRLEADGLVEEIPGPGRLGGLFVGSGIADALNRGDLNGVEAGGRDAVEVRLDGVEGPLVAVQHDAFFGFRGQGRPCHRRPRCQRDGDGHDQKHVPVHRSAPFCWTVNCLLFPSAKGAWVRVSMTD